MYYVRRVSEGNLSICGKSDAKEVLVVSENSEGVLSVIDSSLNVVVPLSNFDAKFIKRMNEIISRDDIEWAFLFVRDESTVGFIAGVENK